MGTVWKAEDTHLRRLVALKFLSEQTASDAQAEARFLREAQAAGSLDHPNICRVHGLEQHEGQPFIVMAFVEGESLARRIRAGLRLGEELDIAIQVGLGLQAAHERGILHRDVKPANVLVSPEGTATITDFGIAFVRDRSRLTLPGTVMGTLTYMAPEQLRAEDADPRTDVWALGVVLYEMCTGRLPFVRADPVALTRAILGENPPRPSVVRPVLPADLDGIAEKALAKTRDYRYQHIDDMVADLRALRRRLTVDPGVLGPVPEAEPDAPTVLAKGRLWLGRLLSRRHPEPPRSDVTSTRAADRSSPTGRAR
jgi:serine/threonine protein kinase